MTTRIAKIPFPGFYCSLYDSEYDATLKRDTEYLSEENPDLADWLDGELWGFVDTSESNLVICQRHVESFNERFREETGIDLGLKFESMTSPREYNFETDRLFAHIPMESLRRVFDMVRYTPEFAETIRDRHTSCSGFVSFIPNDLGTWLAKPLADYDHNEIETLLTAAIAMVADLRDFAESVEMDVIEYGLDNGEFDCLDWSKLTAAMDAERAERMEAESKTWHEIPFRCPHTPDLFQNI